MEGGAGGDMSSSTTPTKKLPPSSNTTSQSSYFLGTSGACSRPSNSPTSQPVSSLPRRVMKNLILSPANYVFGN